MQQPYGSRRFNRGWREHFNTSICMQCGVHSICKTIATIHPLRIAVLRKYSCSLLQQAVFMM